MMPLALADVGAENLILKVGVRREEKEHVGVGGLGGGGPATVVASMSGNIIVKVKEARVAISEEMARKIMV